MPLKQGTRNTIHTYMTSPEIEQILVTVRREAGHTRLVFGVEIIILALILMYIAPMVIRSELQNASMGTMEFKSMHHVQQAQKAATATSSLPNASSTTP